MQFLTDGILFLLSRNFFLCKISAHKQASPSFIFSFVLIKKNKDTINVKKGITLYDYMCVLLSMNVEFFESCTRTIQAEDPEKADAKKKKDAYTKWIKINADTEYLNFDTFKSIKV